MEKRLKGLPRQLVGFLARNFEWHAKGRLTANMTWKHDVGKNYGKRYLPETVGRVLRNLEKKGVIAVKPDGVSVAYKWLPYELRKRYIRAADRMPGLEHTVLRP